LSPGCEDSVDRMTLVLPSLRARSRRSPADLIERSGPTSFDEAFRLGLRELGYTEGHNVVIEYRWADGKTERLPPLAAELVRLKVDVIVTSGTPGGLAAKNATSTIPIVMASGGDFVADGLVASYSRPGGNITGLSVFARELSGKRLEILKEAIPGMTRVAAAFNTLNPGTRSLFKETEAAASSSDLPLSNTACRRSSPTRYTWRAGAS
jgi:putative ABC transport system substrate-binding protein